MKSWTGNGNRRQGCYAEMQSEDIVTVHMGCQCSKGLSILREVTWYSENMDTESNHFDFHSKLGYFRSQGISAEFHEPHCRAVRSKMHVKML